MVKLYQGERADGRVAVLVNGMDMPLRLDLANHSPKGFEWGYGGSGPAQLALAILADFFGYDRELEAIELHQRFKWEFISQILTDSWEITSDEIAQFIDEHGVGVMAW